MDTEDEQEHQPRNLFKNYDANLSLEFEAVLPTDDLHVSNAAVRLYLPSAM